MASSRCPSSTHCSHAVNSLRVISFPLMISVPDDFSTLSLSLTFHIDSSICLLHGSHSLIFKPSVNFCKTVIVPTCHKSHHPAFCPILYSYYSLFFVVLVYTENQLYSLRLQAIILDPFKSLLMTKSNEL